MNPFRLAVVAFVLCALAACNKDGNPVLPTDPGGPSSGALTVTVSCNCAQVEATSSAVTTLRISAKNADGTAPAAGTTVTLNTSLGGFGVDSAGKPIPLVTRTLDSGVADVQFFPGTKAGVANILAQVGASIATLNLTIVDPPPVPVADFTFAKSGLSVLFTDASTGSPASYRWRFGDMTESTERNPMHTYQTPGAYTVTLEVSNSGGRSDKSKFVDVSLGDPPQAAFVSTVAGKQVNFVDRSTGNPTSWSWNFGDGGQSTEQNPVHTYAAAGAYTVVLNVSNAAGSSSTSQVITIQPGSPPVAKFNATITGRQVNFIDQSTGDPTSWSWNFGDNTTSTQRDPIHTYATAGTYTVTLTVSNSAGSNSASEAVKIEPGAPPEAAFAFTVNGRQVNFVDKSKGNPTSWSWNFGDGFTSTQQNPVHIYVAAGSYTVKLTASNADGSSSASDVVVIQAAPPPPKAAFTWTKNERQVAFIDQSSGAPTSWLWDFGDSSGVSAQQNPVHLYAADGSYTVTLFVSNANGSSSVSQVVTVSAAQPISSP